MAKVEIQLQVIIKFLRLLVPEMQLSEEGALEKLLYVMPLILLDILFEFALNLGINRSIQGQYYRLLFTYYLRMGSIVHCLDQYDIVLLFYYLPFAYLVLHFPEKNDTDKLGSFFIVMDYVIGRVVFSL